MAQRIWPSPRLFLSYDGDAQMAYQYIRDVRIFVGYLFDQLRPNQTYRADNRILDDGTTIRACVWRDALGERARAHVVCVYNKIVKRILCNAGLLTWNPLAPSYPLQVYIGGYLQSVVQSGNPYDSPYWTQTRPDIEYPSLIWDFYVDLKYWPSFWSGRARLMLQGLHGYKRDPKEIFGYNPNPDAQGIWKTDGRWWRVDINSIVGVTVQELVVPSGVPEFANNALLLLQDPTADTRQKTLAEACVMSVLVLTGEAQEILSPSEIESVMDEGSAMAYGWKFARNTLKASICTFREECMPEFSETCIGQFVTSLFTITAEFDKTTDVWSASVSNPVGPVRSRPRTAITSIYVPSYGSSIWGMLGKVPGWGENPFPACCYAAIGDTVSPYYCWYDTNDDLQIVWYIQYQLDEATIDERNRSGTICTASFSWGGHYGTSRTRQGGFFVGKDAPSLVNFQDNYSDYEWEEYSVSVASSGDWRWAANGYPYGTEFYNAIAMCCGGTELKAWLDSHYNDVFRTTMYVKFGSQSDHYLYKRVVGNPRSWSFVVAPYDCEAAYVLATGRNVQADAPHIYNWSGTDYPYAGEQLINAGYIKFDFHGNAQGNPIIYSQTLNVSRTKLINQYIYGSVAFGYVINVAKRELATQSGSTSYTDVLDPSYKLHSPHGSISLPTNAYWPTLFPESVVEGMYIDQQPVKVLLSYAGDGMYYSEEGVWEDIGGYPVGMPGLTAFFIGGA